MGSEMSISVYIRTPLPFGVVFGLVLIKIQLLYTRGSLY